MVATYAKAQGKRRSGMISLASAIVLNERASQMLRRNVAFLNARVPQTPS
jgi:hypothetical protein